MATHHPKPNIVIVTICAVAGASIGVGIAMAQDFQGAMRGLTIGACAGIGASIGSILGAPKKTDQPGEDD